MTRSQWSLICLACGVITSTVIVPFALRYLGVSWWHRSPHARMCELAALEIFLIWCSGMAAITLTRRGRSGA